jgi:hypothetical protein
MFVCERAYEPRAADAPYSYEIWHVPALLAKAIHILYGSRAIALAGGAGPPKGHPGSPRLRVWGA